VASIEVLEFFAILLHRDVEAFHVDEAIKEQTWNLINNGFKEKENSGGMK